MVNARGGSSIDEWLPGSETDYLAKAVERIRAAGDWGYAIEFWQLRYEHGEISVICQIAHPSGIVAFHLRQCLVKL